MLTALKIDSSRQIGEASGGQLVGLRMDDGAQTLGRDRAPVAYRFGWDAESREDKERSSKGYSPAAGMEGSCRISGKNGRWWSSAAAGLLGDGGSLVTRRRRQPVAGVRLILVKLMVATSCPGCASFRRIQARDRRRSARRLRSAQASEAQAS
jgi:hypothetical protein